MPIPDPDSLLLKEVERAREQVLREASATGCKEAIVAYVTYFGWEPVLQYQRLCERFGPATMENVTLALLRERGGR